MFQTVLVANRGEIAVRVMRTLRRLGIRSVAVYSDADAGAPHVRAADSAIRIGSAQAAESYLNADRIIEAALAAGADAVHPGYGFLSENAAFAAGCAARGIAYVGPPPRATEIMGDKIRAKQQVESVGVRGIPGRAEPGMTDGDLIAAADDVGYPVLVKPSAGGGGKGMIDVHRRDDLPDALAAARRVARAAFGDDTLFIERLVTSPRHIEVQILADALGTVIHLGERECSLQRRHQKVIEEAPSALLDAHTRERIGQAACDVARSVDYTGAGTVEFLMSAESPDEFFFMEMNTRLQVEHPVTEAVTGIDLVEQQLLIAAGEPLAWVQSDVSLTGHAVEARLYAEDDAFLPQAGRVEHLALPPEARVDSGIESGTIVGSDYDPLLAKIITHANTRSEAFGRMARALEDTVVFGVTTNTAFLRRLVTDDVVLAGTMDTTTIDGRISREEPEQATFREWAVAALGWHAARWAMTDDSLWTQPTGWRLGGPAVPVPITLRLDGETRTLAIAGAPGSTRIDGEDVRLTGDGVRRAITIENETTTASVLLDGPRVWVHSGTSTLVFEHVERDSARAARGVDDELEPELRSPMPGTVVAVPVASGDSVAQGDTILVIEAMKMEHRITAPIAGTLTVTASLNQSVAKDAIVATIASAQQAETADASDTDADDKGDNA